MLAVGFIAFSMFRFIGDPINNMVGQYTSTAEREVLCKGQALMTFSVQCEPSKNALHGNFAILQAASPCSDLIVERLPATLLNFHGCLIGVGHRYSHGSLYGLASQRVLRANFLWFCPHRRFASDFSNWYFVNICFRV